MTHEVIVWDNTGTRSVLEVATEREALAVAKSQRTLAHRTVKVASGGQSWFHWTRSLDVRHNHWCRRAVWDEYLET